MATVIAVVFGVWWRTRITRVARTNVGIGVAIFYEDSEQAKQLRADFVETLRTLLGETNHRHRFQLVEFSQSLSKRMNDERADWLVRKANVHFLIYGRARRREVPTGPSHVLDLRWLVRHAPINSEQSQELAIDANALFPRRMILPSTDMLATEFAAQLVEAVANFVIGMAAFVSGDFIYAEQLLLAAENKLQFSVGKADGPSPSVFLDRTRKRLIALYNAWIDRCITNYILKRNKDNLRTAEPFIAKLRGYDATSNAAHLLAAIIAFVLHRDVNGARRELNACRTWRDGSWIYSDAFLVVYGGDLDAGTSSIGKRLNRRLAIRVSLRNARNSSKSSLMKNLTIRGCISVSG